ncbi:MAG: phosphate signaling complex protein PhoU [Pseudomonadota bacterium]
MNSPHIVSSFDSDLEAIQAHVVRMAGLVEDAVRKSVRALSDRDVALAKQVREGDRAIDELEELIKVETAQVIALRAPAAIDLRVVLATLAISNNLERCGDYAKNIAKRTPTLVDLPQIRETQGALNRMEAMVREMLSDATDSYIHRDVERATQVIARDVDADEMYNNLFRSLLTHMMEDPRNIAAGMHLHFIAKNIERMGDLATAIAEQTIYLVTGELPDEDRPKSDVTATES